MLSPANRRKIIDLIQREVIPAIGCTEPICVAYATAYATKVLGCKPRKVSVYLSANILKNAMGVGIPGTGMIGLPIAIALGATIGNAELGLQVLRDVDDEAVAEARKMIDAGAISINLKDGCTEKLYAEAVVKADGHTATVVVSNTHTHVSHVEKDGGLILSAESGSADSDEDNDPDQLGLTLKKVWEFATTTPTDELRFILESRKLNKAAAEQAFTANYGHSVGRTLHCERQRAIMGDSIFSRILSYTSAACDARMGGACIPVMSNSGSGNQGIAATLPVVVYAEETFATEEQTIRALALSHLTVIYIKQSLGRLSALCGCVVAATGSTCGMVYLMGGGYENVAAAVKNMIANLTGMICDGAKPGCAMKLTSGVSTAVISAMMAMEGHCVTPVEGIIDDDVDTCIRNLTTIGRSGMNETDKLILSIMTGKK